MKRINGLWYILIVPFAFGLLYSVAIGYLFHSTLYKAGVNSYSYHINKIESARLSKNQDLEICVTAKLDGEKESKELLMQIPLSQIVGLTLEEAEKNNPDFSFSVTEDIGVHKKRIREGCDEIMQSDRISVTSVPLGKYLGLVDHDLQKLIQQQEVGMAIYQVRLLDYDGKKRNEPDQILLISANKIIDDNQFLFIELGGVNKRGSLLWYLVLPFAMIGDALSWPYQIHMWIEYRH